MRTEWTQPGQGLGRDAGPPDPVQGMVRATGRIRLGRVRRQLSGEDGAAVAPERPPQVPVLTRCQVRKPGELAVPEGAAWGCTGHRSPERGFDRHSFGKTHLS